MFLSWQDWEILENTCMLAIYHCFTISSSSLLPSMQEDHTFLSLKIRHSHVNNPGQWKCEWKWCISLLHRSTEDLEHDSSWSSPCHSDCRSMCWSESSKRPKSLEYWAVIRRQLLWLPPGWRVFVILSHWDLRLFLLCFIYRSMA